MKTTNVLAHNALQQELRALGMFTGCGFVLTTDAGAPDQRESLRHTYSELFMGHVSKTPRIQRGRVFRCARALYRCCLVACRPGRSSPWWLGARMTQIGGMQREALETVAQNLRGHLSVNSCSMGRV